MAHDSCKRPSDEPWMKRQKMYADSPRLTCACTHNVCFSCTRENPTTDVSGTFTTPTDLNLKPLNSDMLSRVFRFPNQLTLFCCCFFLMNIAQAGHMRNRAHTKTHESLAMWPRGRARWLAPHTGLPPLLSRVMRPNGNNWFRIQQMHEHVLSSALLDDGEEVFSVFTPMDSADIGTMYAIMCEIKSTRDWIDETG